MKVVDRVIGEIGVGWACRLHHLRVLEHIFLAATGRGFYVSPILLATANHYPGITVLFPGNQHQQVQYRIQL